MTNDPQAPGGVLHCPVCGAEPHRTVSAIAKLVSLRCDGIPIGGAPRHTVYVQAAAGEEPDGMWPRAALAAEPATAGVSRAISELVSFQLWLLKDAIITESGGREDFDFGHSDERIAIELAGRIAALRGGK